MKILFAADWKFRYFDSYIGNEYIGKVFSDLLPTMKKADFRMVNFKTSLSDGSCSPIGVASFRHNRKRAKMSKTIGILALIFSF